MTTTSAVSVMRALLLVPAPAASIGQADGYGTAGSPDAG